MPPKKRQRQIRALVFVKRSHFSIGMLFIDFGRGSVGDWWGVGVMFPAAVPRIRRFNSDGTLEPSQFAREAGFEPGVYIQRKKDQTLAQINSFSKDNVLVEVEDGPISGKATFKIATLLQGSWKVVERKAEPQDVEGLTDLLPLSSPAFLAHCLRGQVMQALFDLEAAHHHVHEQLRVQVKPVKAVFATEAFPKGKLVLVPCSLKLDGRRLGQIMDGNKTSLCLGQLSLKHAKLATCESMVFWIQPFFSDGGKDKTKPGFVSPFFCVRLS